MIWLSGKNIRTERTSRKLDHRFNRHYPVVEPIGMQTYHLKLLQPAGSIQNVFHVLLHEQYVSDRRTAPKPPPPIDIGNEDV